MLNLKINNQLDVEPEKLMLSYLHMLNNRLFKSKQRKHELVLYNFLYNHYRSKLAREGVRFN